MDKIGSDLSEKWRCLVLTWFSSNNWAFDNVDMSEGSWITTHTKKSVEYIPVSWLMRFGGVAFSTSGSFVVLIRAG